MRLGGLGEGYWDIERAQPLTQLRLASKLASLRNPLPLERDTIPATKNPARLPERGSCDPAAAVQGVGKQRRMKWLYRVMA